jgi:hypothetical protein
LEGEQSVYDSHCGLSPYDLMHMGVGLHSSRFRQPLGCAAPADAALTFSPSGSGIFPVADVETDGDGGHGSIRRKLTFNSTFFGFRALGGYPVVGPATIVAGAAIEGVPQVTRLGGRADRTSGPVRSEPSPGADHNEAVGNP